MTLENSCNVAVEESHVLSSACTRHDEENTSLMIIFVKRNKVRLGHVKYYLEGLSYVNTKRS